MAFRWSLPGPLDAAHRAIVAVCRRDVEANAVDAAVHAVSEGPHRFLGETAAHGVSGLVLATIERHGGFDRMHTDSPRFALRDARRRAALIDLQLERILEVLEPTGVRPVLLKGAALRGRVYEDPVERELFDLDLFVEREHVKTVVRALAAEGYGAPRGLAETRRYVARHFHVPLYRDGACPVEVHWTFTKPSDPFVIDPSVVASRAEVDGRARIPRLETTLLHVVLQNVQESFSRLCRTVDVDRIVAATALDWDDVARRAIDGGLAHPVALSLQLAAGLFETPVPAEVRAAVAPDRAARVHLAAMRPREALLAQWVPRTDAGFRTQGWWLRSKGRRRLRDLVGFARSDRRDSPTGDGLGHALARVVKMGALHLYLYAASAVRLVGGQMRFWSSH